MSFDDEIACEKWLRLNKELWIIDVWRHIIHFKFECKKELLNIICCDCGEEKKAKCKEREIFEEFLE
jgi:hypothetical protein